jgi:hypothetical protein
MLLCFVPFQFGLDVLALHTQAFGLTESRLKPLWHPTTRQCTHLRDGQHESRVSILKRTEENAARLTTATPFHTVPQPAIASSCVLRVAPSNATH